MIFSSYRNLANFYISSTALSSSLINFLYLFYLLQTIRSKVLSEINCRAIYYLQTSCIVVLAYTVIAMHANFVLCLFPPPISSDKNNLLHRCYSSCNRCLRRVFRRFCFCFVIFIWCTSFTSTIPLLYTIDSNEKSPKPVYCPGTKEITYLDEWFDRNRLTQTVIFNLIPLLISIVLSLIALLKLLNDCLSYIYLRVTMLKCYPFRRNPTQTIILSEHACQQWFTITFLRFILVLSSCLLACIYPVVMRFYLIYFSVLVPLIFAVFNYSSGYSKPTSTQTIIENQNLTVTNSIARQTSEQLELRSPFIANLLNKPDELHSTTSNSPAIYATPEEQHRPFLKPKRKYFTNHLYENTRSEFV